MVNGLWRLGRAKRPVWIPNYYPAYPSAASPLCQLWRDLSNSGMSKERFRTCFRNGPPVSGSSALHRKLFRGRPIAQLLALIGRGQQPGSADPYSDRANRCHCSTPARSHIRP